MKRLSFCFAIAVIGIAAFGFPAAPACAAKNKEYNPVINPADFVAEANNVYFPLVPGTTFVYEADTDEGLIEDVVTVTDQTKQILGVTCTVVTDTETVDANVVEDTVDWYAQDKKGNVWYFGEFTTQYEDGNAVGHEGSWEADVNGAKPGIVMQANPKRGQSYRQEFLAGVAEDMAKVLRLNGRVSIAYGDFEDCLVTKEWSPLERGAIEQKFYAPGVGLVLIMELKGKTVRMELVDIIVQ